MPKMTEGECCGTNGGHQHCYRVGILGVTGAVGQRFCILLEHHPWFRITALGASERSSGQKYKDVVKFKVGPEIPETVKDEVILPCSVSAFKEKGVDIVFSGLDSSVAGDIEQQFASAGIPVFSNAKNYRMAKDVPILIPYINSDHLRLIEQQDCYKNSKGYIVTNANCASTGLCIALQGIHRQYTITEMIATTCQAISGAGYPGLPSLDILDNCVPYIGDEEPKIETEPKKILGVLSSDSTSIDEASITTTAMCHRVAVSDGHMVSIALRFKNSPPPSPDDIKRVMNDFKPDGKVQSLPSCPPQVLKLFEQEDRPQPRLDRMEGGGMTTCVGRVRKCPVMDIKFTTVSHNTIIGAAGGSILNAELAAVQGYITQQQTAK